MWRENTYPGAACDVPSPFYSFSFETNPNWPHRFSRQPAILDYIRHVADKYDIRRHIRFGTEVLGATYDSAAGTRQIELSNGVPLVVDVPVSAVGQLSRPSYPAIPGADTFAGPAFHSALWDHDVDLAGKRVAVIGTGASAIQFVPAIQPEVGHLTLFQRTPPHIVPGPDREFTRLHHLAFDKVRLAHLLERGTRYGVTESLSVALGLLRAAREDRQRDLQATHAQADEGRARSLREGLADLPDRLQARPVLQRLPPGTGPVQRRCHHGGHHGDHAVRRRHRGRSGA
ncbi:flavin-containing monooxygenase [Nocardioides sp. B-3]|uniref:flavin-containing monooxygenase n=1 Tax=Nocardioides sp. B-3 TaxID=2895565 RepID=UPI002152DA85|nr:NAD(P)/FAD-dependent oxidoreductase [Nocardioides sp. B-3]UUZ58474.1 NAD(P)/FAD-dependent oxidoreductase [Nocardioides sp. B-3]